MIFIKNAAIFADQNLHNLNLLIIQVSQPVASFTGLHEVQFMESFVSPSLLNLY